MVIVIGWNVTHRKELERGLAAKRRELSVQFLIDAYRRLEYASARPELSPESAAEIERTFADIQLFGTPKLVEMVQSTMIDWEARGSTSLTPLLMGLRESLRTELRLEPVPSKLEHLRLGRPARFPHYERSIQ